jgi:hypothetical protein
VMLRVDGKRRPGQDRTGTGAGESKAGTNPAGLAW